MRPQFSAFAGTQHQSVRREAHRLLSCGVSDYSSHSELAFLVMQHSAPVESATCFTIAAEKSRTEGGSEFEYRCRARLADFKQQL
jgi:hypothetical protein